MPPVTERISPLLSSVVLLTVEMSSSSPPSDQAAVYKTMERLQQMANELPTYVTNDVMDLIELS